VTFLQSAAQPIVVRVVEQPVHDTSIADVIIGAIGLTGLLLLTAALLGGVLGAILIGIKLLRARYNLEPVSDSEGLRIT
jgi:hypothetical protein